MIELKGGHQCSVACGQAIHPCFEIGGVCENCFAERAEKLHLPGCRSVYHSPATEEDCHTDQIVTRRSEANRHDRRHATSALWRVISCFAPARATPSTPSRSCAITDPNTLSPAAPSKVRGHLAGGGSRESHRQQNIETRRRQVSRRSRRPSVRRPKPMLPPLRRP